MKTKESIKYIPLGIATLLTIPYFIENTFFQNLQLENDGSIHFSYYTKFSLSYVGLLISIILLLLKNEYWKHAFATLLLAGTFHLVQIFHLIFSIEIGFIHIDITSLLLLIAHIKVNPVLSEEIKPMLKKNEKQHLQSNEFKIQFFEKKFEKNDIFELRVIVQENTLIPEAIEAAKRVIRKKEERDNNRQKVMG
ncbi:hypothetical protein [Flammeovirga sp. EKP202]|uniref:hypothetical protein n=1 Tax=Flammeovirga sp. EKP202 TaxID=2770592 RepID=UPI00165F4395|nr:hypothetical protein [Flammeovirga sp. EKP202]MBD0402447.1 hypothetical protein [Flammeovirga sp. EKP202]